eukprot:jgi/Psemu1/37794/gm1.37794_g
MRIHGNLGDCARKEGKTRVLRKWVPEGPLKTDSHDLSAYEQIFFELLGPPEPMRGMRIPPPSSAIALIPHMSPQISVDAQARCSVPQDVPTNVVDIAVLEEKPTIDPHDDTNMMFPCTNDTTKSVNDSVFKPTSDTVTYDERDDPANLGGIDSFLSMEFKYKRIPDSIIWSFPKIHYLPHPKEEVNHKEEQDYQDAIQCFGDEIWHQDAFGEDEKKLSFQL